MDSFYQRVGPDEFGDERMDWRCPECGGEVEGIPTPPGFGCVWPPQVKCADCGLSMSAEAIYLHRDGEPWDHLVWREGGSRPDLAGAALIMMPAPLEDYPTPPED